MYSRYGAITSASSSTSYRKLSPEVESPWFTYPARLKNRSPFAEMVTLVTVSPCIAIATGVGQFTHRRFADESAAVMSSLSSNVIQGTALVTNMQPVSSESSTPSESVSGEDGSVPYASSFAFVRWSPSGSPSAPLPPEGDNGSRPF